MNRLLLRSAVLTGAAALALTGATAPANAAAPATDRGASCVDPNDDLGAAARGDDGGRGADHRDISAKEQRAIERRTRALLENNRSSRSAVASASVPVYVHVMRDNNGNGDVTSSQVSQQINVLNTTYGGEESSSGADTGFSFYLAGLDRYDNSAWHADQQSTTYRSQTRQGGSNALNIWLVDFDYLGVATFPWDYSSQGSIDGIRVQYTSLPGGSATNYNLGKTTTHEAGHWLGLYHTFQGGCTTSNDLVTDTPAQSGPSSGCPTGRDSCSLSGLDPVHNYMDYSYDSCYDRFSQGQSSRMASAWDAYRG